MHDIYNPPPAPVAYAPAPPAPVSWTVADLAFLFGLCIPLGVASIFAWRYDVSLAPWVMVGGGFVVVESWLSGLTFLHRHPAARPTNRWLIFGAALVPWLLGLGIAGMLMLGLFTVSDWATR